MNPSPDPQSSSAPTRLIGWYVGIGVLLITLGVVAGMIGIFITAKRKQQYRIEPSLPASTNSPSAANSTWDNGMERRPAG